MSRLGLIWCLLFCTTVIKAELPQKITVCQLKLDPAAFNHSLVEVTGFFSKSFENFTLSDPGCSSGSDVWLEYGGTVSSGTVYCCTPSNDRRRSAPFVVEGIRIPLIADMHFQEFDRSIQNPAHKQLRASVIGRFFSGQKQERLGHLTWGGFGHFGCCSLLVIQQVLSVGVRP